MSSKENKDNQAIESARILSSLGDKLFTNDFSNRLLVNHASYIRDSSTKTLAHFNAFLMGQPLLGFWLSSTLKGLVYILRDICSLGGVGSSKIIGNKGLTDVLVVSHLINEDQLGQVKDPYFADLVGSYSEKNSSISILSLNSSRIPINVKKLGARQLIESGRFGLLEGSVAWVRNAGQSLQLIWQSMCCADPVYKRYLAFLACTQMDHRTIAATRIVDRIVILAAKLQVKVLVLTFEGYSWERAAIARLRDLNPDIVVLGYQHAVISGGPRAINKKFYRGIDPDHLLAAGSAMTEVLIREGDYSSSDFTIIGSSKARNAVESKERNSNVLLAVPEGTLSETVLLADCVCEIARRKPDITCILRLHPALDWSKVRPKLNDWDSALANLHLSNTLLAEDIDCTNWLLYRGSSVAIIALQAGKRPIFLDVDDSSETGDIIPRKISWRRICKTAVDVIEIIEADQADGWPESRTAQALAQDFAREYYKPLDHKSFEKVISSYLK